MQLATEINTESRNKYNLIYSIMENCDFQADFRAFLTTKPQISLSTDVSTDLSPTTDCFTILHNLPTNINMPHHESFGVR